VTRQLEFGFNRARRRLINSVDVSNVEPATRACIAQCIPGKEARVILSRMPSRLEEELDPVTLHNQALFHVEERPASAIDKLQFLLRRDSFPVEAFQNLLLLYVKYEVTLCVKRPVSRVIIVFPNKTAQLYTANKTTQWYNNKCKQGLDVRLKLLRGDMTQWLWLRSLAGESSLIYA